MPPDHVPLRVLYVEDLEADAELMTLALRRSGYTVASRRVMTAVEMLTALSNDPWDLVISDYSLPSFDAPGAMATLRASGFDLPLIIVSGTVDEESAVAALRAGAHDFITKSNLARLGPAVQRELREAENRRQRRQAEARLHEQEASFRLLFESNPLPMWVYDAENLAFLEVNTAAVSHYGYTRDEFLQMDFAGIQPAEDIPVLLANLKADRPSYRPAEPHWRHRLKDGRIINVEITAHALLFRGRDAVLVVAHDITERVKAAAALQASETELRALFAAMTDVISVVDADGRYLKIAPTDARFLYAPPETMLGKTVHEIFPPAQADDFVACIRDALETRSPVRYEYRLPTQGQNLWFEATLSPLGEETVFFIARDITKRKLAEAAVRESEARTRLIVDTALDAVVTIDHLSTITSWNPQAERTFGWTQLEALGQSIYNLIIPDRYQEAHRRGLAHFLATGEGPVLNKRIEITSQHRDGHEFPVELAITPIKSGETFIFSAFVRDISERQRAQAALEARERRFRALIENSADAITLVDRDGTITYDSPAAPKLLGYEPDELIGRRAFELFHPDDVPSNQALLQELIEKPGGRVSSEFRLRHKTEAWRWMEAVASNLLAEPSVQAIVVNYRDITERKQAERDLREADRRAIRDYERLLGRLTNLAQAVGTAPEIVTVYRSLRAFIEISVPCNRLFVALYNAERNERRAVYAGGDGQDTDVTTLAPMPMNASQQSQAIITKEVIVVDDLQQAQAEAGLAPVLVGVGSHPRLLRSSMAVPLIVMGKVIGVLEVQSVQPAAYTPQDVTAVRMAANLAAIATENLQLLDREREQRRAAEETAHQLQRQLGHVAGLRAIDTAITSSLDLRFTLAVILEQVTTQLGVHAADVLLLSPHSLELTYAAGHGLGASMRGQRRQRLGEGHAGKVALERQLVGVTNLREGPAQFGPSNSTIDQAFASYYGVPLMAKGEVKGVLEVFHRDPLAPDAEWLAFLHTLAGQAAIAIDNAQLFENLQAVNRELVLAYDATLEGWSRALDLRDKETEGHSRRVTELTSRLGRTVGMSEEELMHVRRGALLHDIGKLGIPDGILLKPGKLTDDEWAIMKQHSSYGYELLAPIAHLRQALDIPYCHHEKWDGTGYPRGLKGEQIPLAARLFAVVDVWDALRSDRPYRPAWPAERALEHIRSQVGRHFDPQAVEAFLHLAS